MEASLVHTYWPAAMALATGHSPGPMGSAHPVAAPYQAFPTQDGWLNIGAISKATWIGVSEVLELPGLLTDERFKDNAGRMQHLNDLVKLISDVLQTQPTEHWAQAFERAGVPAGPVKNIKQALDDPQTRVRDMEIGREWCGGRGGTCGEF